MWWEVTVQSEDHEQRRWIAAQSQEAAEAGALRMFSEQYPQDNNPEIKSIRRYI